LARLLFIASSITLPSGPVVKAANVIQNTKLVMMASSHPLDSMISGTTYEFSFDEEGSTSNQCSMELTEDGNLVVRSYNSLNDSWDLKWESASGEGEEEEAIVSYYLHLQKNHGNLVLYRGDPNFSERSDAIWATHTGRQGVQLLVIDGNCDLYLQKRNGEIAWTTYNDDDDGDGDITDAPNDTPTTSTPTVAPQQVFVTSEPTVTDVSSLSPSFTPSASFVDSTDTPTAAPQELFVSITNEPSNAATTSTDEPTLAPQELIPVSSSPSAQQEEEQTTSMPSFGPTQLETSTPTFEPTSSLAPSPISQQLCGLTSAERRIQILNVLNTVSDPVLLDTVGTPQNSAAEWLIENDESFLCPSSLNDDGEDDNNEILLTQRYVMTVLYYSTGGDNWNQCNEQDVNCLVGNSYLSPTNECTWFGSTCDEDNKITEIAFEDNNLVGTIPNEIAQLSSLQTLSLEQGNLTSSIPSTLANLSSLRILDLDFNRITGPIPEEIYSLSTLEQMDLNTNLITGTISSSVGNLQNLRLFQLYENLMTGAIPKELSSVGGLVIAEFYNNTFTGVMPQEICDNVSPLGSITALTADCFPNPTPQVVCSCCTGCALD